PVSVPDAVDASDVRLVLDGARTQERLPVLAPQVRPVGDDNVEVGFRGGLPEGLWETQVIADEGSDAHTVDLDGYDVISRSVVEMLAPIGEGGNLRVARDETVL